MGITRKSIQDAMKEAAVWRRIKFLRTRPSSQHKRVPAKKQAKEPVHVSPVAGARPASGSRPPTRITLTDDHGKETPLSPLVDKQSGNASLKKSGNALSGLKTFFKKIGKFFNPDFTHSRHDEITYTEMII